MFKRKKLKQQVSLLFLTLSFFSYAEEKILYNTENVKKNFRIEENTIFYNKGTIEDVNSTGVLALKNAKVYNSGTVKNSNGIGIDGEGASTIINESNGKIFNNDGPGIRLTNGEKLSNEGKIRNDSKYGIAAYTTKEVINEEGATIENSKNYGFYLYKSEGINNGTIANTASYGACVATGSFFVNNNIITNIGDIGVAIYDSKFVNSKTGKIENKGNIGVQVHNSEFENFGEIKNTGDTGIWIVGNSFVTNYGTIANEGDIGVQVENSGTFVNHGTISQKGKISILLGGGDNTLELGTDSKIKGVIEGNRGTDTLILSESPTSKTSKIDYQIKNFSNIAIKSGTWTLDNNLILAVPDKYKDKNTTFSQPPFPINEMNGNFKIEKNRNLIMNIEVSDLLTPTILY